MTDKEYQILMDGIKELSKKEVSPEEARRELIDCGIMNKDGHWVVPEAVPYLLGLKPISELRRRD